MHGTLWNMKLALDFQNPLKNFNEKSIGKW